MDKYDICVISPPEDAPIANSLADSIRRYRLSGGVAPSSPGLDYRHIYVDSSASAFDAHVQHILDNSRYLVIICTPRTKHNPEIIARCHYFKKIRRDEDIVAVIADGEPVDSFPEFLIEKKVVQHIMPDMRIIEREETIEPVASDLRGNTPARRRHALKYETVRIVASVLGLHPDALVQRHRRRSRHAALTVAGIVSAVCLAAAVIFLSLGLIARNEGKIAQQQTQLSLEASQRLAEELPLMFADNEQALMYIQEAVDHASEALSSIEHAQAGEG